MLLKAINHGSAQAILLRCQDRCLLGTWGRQQTQTDVQAPVIFLCRLSHFWDEAAILEGLHATAVTNWPDQTHVLFDLINLAFYMETCGTCLHIRKRPGGNDAKLVTVYSHTGCLRLSPAMAIWFPIHFFAKRLILHLTFRDTWFSEFFYGYKQKKKLVYNCGEKYII